MEKAFITFIQKQQLFTTKTKMVVAVSGGIDSVVLVHLLQKSGFKIAIAHCNFQLRGKESDQDAFFVQQLADQYGLSFHMQCFDTKVYSQHNHLSIQMAARELRYNWFQQLCNENQYEKVVVGHHLDDQKETFFINLIRGSGLAGLKGMVVSNGNIVRPLLFASREQITEYAISNAIAFREDSSNIKTKYLRNSIRHRLLPAFNSTIESASEGLSKSLELLTENQLLYAILVKEKIDELKRDNVNTIVFDKAKLLMYSNLNSFIFECFSPYGFSGATISEIQDCLHKQAGKLFLSHSHQLTINISNIEIRPLSIEQVEDEYLIDERQNKMEIPANFIFTKKYLDSKFKIEKDQTIAALDFDKLIFPMKLRKWKNGDRFIPIGMKGSKLLSDFFNDLRFTQAQKDAVWVLCSKDETIVWVVGYRMSQKFAITPKTKQVLIIKYNQ